MKSVAQKYGENISTKRIQWLNLKIIINIQEKLSKNKGLIGLNIEFVK